MNAKRFTHSFAPDRVEIEIYADALARSSEVVRHRRDDPGHAGEIFRREAKRPRVQRVPVDDVGVEAAVRGVADDR